MENDGPIFRDFTVKRKYLAGSADITMSSPRRAPARKCKNRRHQADRLSRLLGGRELVVQVQNLHQSHQLQTATETKDDTNVSNKDSSESDDDDNNDDDDDEEYCPSTDDCMVTDMHAQTQARPITRQQMSKKHIKTVDKLGVPTGSKIHSIRQSDSRNHMQCRDVATSTEDTADSVEVEFEFDILITYKCRQCDYSSHIMSHLRKHMDDSHSGYKPHISDRKFRMVRPQNLSSSSKSSSVAHNVKTVSNVKTSTMRRYRTTRNAKSLAKYSNKPLNSTITAVGNIKAETSVAHTDKIAVSQSSPSCKKRTVLDKSGKALHENIAGTMRTSEEDVRREVEYVITALIIEVEILLAVSDIKSCGPSGVSDYDEADHFNGVSEESATEDTATEDTATSGTISKSSQPTPGDGDDDYSANLARICQRVDDLVKNAQIVGAKCKYENKLEYQKTRLAKAVQHESEGESHKCAECEQFFCNASSLKGHVFRRHSGKNPRFRPLGRRNKNMLCPLCDRQLASVRLLAYHIACKHEGLSRGMAAKTFLRNYEQCPHCPYVAPNKTALQPHLNMHTRKVKHQCDICQNTFAQKPSLIRHKISQHSSGPVVRNFVCAHCGKAFLHKGNMVAHMRIHDEKRVRPVCDECGYTFVTVRSLRRHKYLKHSGEAALQCSHCGQMMKSEPALRIHLVAKHDVQTAHKCAACGKCFIHEDFLRRHLSSAHGTEVDGGCRQVCDICGKAFAIKQQLQRHYRKVHRVLSGSSVPAVTGMLPQ